MRKLLTAMAVNAQENQNLLPETLPDIGVSVLMPKIELYLE